MKANIIYEHGDSSKIKYEEVAQPQIGNNEVLLRLEAIGVNFVDIYHRKGLYKTKLPHVPGQEGAGIVEKIGTGVKNFSVGDRVVYQGITGAYAEYQSVPEEKIYKLPKEISTKDAAALMLQGLTAHYLTRSTFRLKGGDICLLHAAAGGVGLLLTQIAKNIGAKVIGTVSTEEKAELAKKAGCDEVILYSKNDFEIELSNITGGKGVDVVYDSVGKTTFEKSLNCLKPRGYLVLFGQASGPVPPFELQKLNAKGSLFITRPSLKHYTLTYQELTSRADELFLWFKQGKIKIYNVNEYPLKDAAKAQDDLENRRTKGKVILIP